MGLRNTVTQEIVSGLRNSKDDEISLFEADIVPTPHDYGATTGELPL